MPDRSGSLGLVVHPTGRGVLHASGIEAEHLAELGIVGGQGWMAFLLSSELGSRKDVVQMGQQVGADHRGDQDVAAFGGLASVGSPGLRNDAP